MFVVYCSESELGLTNYFLLLHFLMEGGGLENGNNEWENGNMVKEIGMCLG